MTTENLTNTEKLDQLIELTRENNELLKDLRGRARWALLFRIIYWSIIFASVFGLYYYLQPYTDQIKTNFSLFKDLFSKISSSGMDFSETGQIVKFLESFKNTN